MLDFNAKKFYFGKFCEFTASKILSSKGYKIIKKRYKNFYGEIDIIAKKLDLIIFVEVKGRKREEPIEIVLQKNQISRIRKSAEFFISQNLEYQNCDLRFDFVYFYDDFKYEYFENYF